MNVLNLFINPRRFFGDQAVYRNKILTVLATWFFGMEIAITEIDRRLLPSLAFAKNGVPNQAIELVVSSWHTFWATVVFGGVFAAALGWVVAGWWYGIRLKWSGAKSPDALRVRKVFVFQELIYVLPLLALAIAESMVFATYKEAWRAGFLWTGAPLFLFFVLSCRASFSGATTAFVVSRSRAMVWFVALPILTYLLALGFVIYIALWKR